MASTKKPQQSKSAHNPTQAASFETKEAALLLSPPQPSSYTDKLYHQFAHNVSQAIQTFNLKPSSVLVGLSGGLDSCVLLHMLRRLAQTENVFAVHAMHIHHGMSKNADDWSHFCEQLCAQYAVPLRVVRVKLTHATGMGVEAEARALRYEALLNSEHDCVMVAHHQDDQAETLLLQLLRGAGVRGMAGMATYNPTQKLLRPLLNISRANLERYAQEHQLQWVDDESNAEQAYDRNYIRHTVMPTLAQRYPQVQKVLARSATHMAEASVLVDDLAQLDSVQCLDRLHLRLDALTKLSLPRQKNLLRWWLQQQGLMMPEAKQLDELRKQLLSARTDSNLKVVLDHARGIALRRYQGMAYVSHASGGLQHHHVLLNWQENNNQNLPDGSRLQFKRMLGQGLDMGKFGQHPLIVRYRQGGERFRPDGKRPTRTLKHLLQEANIAPSLRERLPLVYLQDTLVLVPGLGVATGFQVPANEQGLSIVWSEN